MTEATLARQMGHADGKEANIILYLYHYKLYKYNQEIR